MPRSLLRVTRLAPADRLVIGLLRGHFPSGLAEPDRAIFTTLRDAALGEGLTLPPAANPFVNLDEIRLLGALATMQRQRSSRSPMGSKALTDALAAAATGLAASGTFLDHRNLARLHGREPTARVSSRPPPPSTRRSFKAPAPSTLQHRVLGFVDRHGAIESRRLQDFGASRQVISIMFQRRLLNRERAGIYRVSPEAQAWLQTHPIEDTPS